MEPFDEHTKGILREEKTRDLHQRLDDPGEDADEGGLGSHASLRITIG
jgi:hypothetical protein